MIPRHIITTTTTGPSPSSPRRRPERWRSTTILPLRLQRILCLFSVLLLLLNLGVVVEAKREVEPYSSSLPIDLPTDRRYAFVTLLYSDDFALGVRTLGQSLRATRNPRRHNIDFLVLITPDVGEEMAHWLEQEDGWKVKRVKAAPNPNQHYDKRLHGVYTKLEIFRLVEYHRVVYLDADTTVLENVDELFLCGPFCAVMRHSELINTGVIVAEPSYALYNDLKTKVGMGMYSYTGGDQGFLNSYYSDYAACPYFEPLKQIGLGSDGSKCRRLPHRYNGDWPYVMMNGKLEMVRTRNKMSKEFGTFRRSRILHYTVGSFKPWDWYSAVVFPFTFHWTRSAAQLSSTPQDTKRFHNEMIWICLGLSAFVLWIITVLQASSCCANNKQQQVSHNQTKSSSWWWRCCCCCCCNVIKCIPSLLRQRLMPTPTTTTRRTSTSTGTTDVTTTMIIDDPLSKGSLVMHLIMGYLCFTIAVGGGFFMVPTHTHHPVIGFSIFLLWTFSFFFSLYSIYLYRWYLQGEAQSRTTIKVSSPKLPDIEQPLQLLRSTNLSTRSSSSSTSSSTTCQAARTESFTYAMGMVAFVVWFVLLRIHTHPVSLWQIAPPMIGLATSLFLGLTVAFYRLPLLWYQEGLSLTSA